MKTEKKKKKRQPHTFPEHRGMEKNIMDSHCVSVPMLQKMKEEALTIAL